ncbi:MAG TPA: hypothetical protein VGM29_06410 [Polyangiaceae bacterium]|jgi:hypothetical protein
MNEPTGRGLLRQGFRILLLSFVLGFGIVAGGPHARGFMATHVTGMLTAIFAVLIGLAWPSLALSLGQRKWLYWSVVIDGYWGLIAGVFATLYEVPGPVSGGGAAPHGWQATVFFSAFIPVLTALPFVFTGLALYGLRGTGAPKA